MSLERSIPDSSRKRLANRMVTSLPKFGAWAEAIREYDTPWGNYGFRQLSLLWALRFHDISPEAPTPSAIAAYFQIQPSVVTRLLARLEEHGCIRRVTDPNDGRSVTIEVTELGMDLSRYVENIYDEEMSEALAFLSDDEVTELRRVVETLDMISTKLLNDRKQRVRPAF